MNYRIDIELVRAAIKPMQENERRERTVFGVGYPNSLSLEKGLELAADIKRGGVPALRAFLEFMRYFTEQKLFDLALGADHRTTELPLGAYLAEAFKEFEATLIRAFREHEAKQSPVRSDGSGST